MPPMNISRTRIRGGVPSIAPLAAAGGLTTQVAVVPAGEPAAETAVRAAPITSPTRRLRTLRAPKARILRPGRRAGRTVAVIPVVATAAAARAAIVVQAVAVRAAIAVAAVLVSRAAHVRAAVAVAVAEAGRRVAVNPAAASLAGSPAWADRLSGRGGLTVFGSDRQAHVERRALADFGDEIECPAVTRDHAVGDGKALSGAFAHFLGGEEGLKDPLADRFGNAAARVADA